MFKCRTKMQVLHVQEASRQLQMNQLLILTMPVYIIWEDFLKL